MSSFSKIIYIVTSIVFAVGTVVGLLVFPFRNKNSMFSGLQALKSIYIWAVTVILTIIGGIIGTILKFTKI